MERLIEYGRYRECWGAGGIDGNQPVICRLLKDVVDAIK